jgi:hypothetical protein
VSVELNLRQVRARRARRRLMFVGETARHLPGWSLAHVPKIRVKYIWTTNLTSALTSTLCELPTMVVAIPQIRGLDDE